MQRAVTTLTITVATSSAVLGQSNVAAWGGNFEGQLNVPPGEYVMVVGGSESSVGLRSDGTLIHWGDRNPPCALHLVPPGAFVSVACDDVHCIALRANGSIAFWGCPAGNQAQVPKGVFTTIAAGRHWDAAIRSDGAVVAWGGGSTPPRVYPGPYIAVAAGWQFVVGVRADTRTLQMIEDFTSSSNFLTLPSGQFRALGASDMAACGIRVDGTLAAFGGCGFSQCPAPTGSFQEVAGGTYHFVALRTDGTLAAWGDNIVGQTNAPPGQYVSVGAGNGHSFAVRACRPNCDQSTVAPLLNVNDFLCFINQFAASDPRANCDGSTILPMLNVNDFVCFNNQFGAGCT
ncbi:MAG: GC-type dockerin domain-anchored protein [Phycisphaerales bacterium]